MYLALFIQALFTLFIAGGLFFYANGLKNRSLAVYAVLFCLEICYFIYGTTNISLAVPEIYGFFYHSAGVLYGPLLWFHFKTTVQPKTKLTTKDLLHLIPLVIINLMLIDYTLSSFERKYELSHDVNFFMERIMPANYFRAAHQLVYAVFLIFFVKKNKEKLNTNVLFYLSGIALIFIIANIVISLFTLFANSWLDFKWYYIFSNLFIFIIVFVLYRDPQFFKTFKAKYQSSSLSVQEMKTIRQQLEKLFSKEKSYLQNNLSVDQLAEKLQTKSQYISRTFSEHIKENFNDYVNKHRIVFAKQLLKDEKFKHYKIEVIAEEAGFNNKVTFYKAFSKFTNTTPSKFRKENNV
ncbi:helix-turn-helix domain-containing protein [uncultured Kordia sp.]|uniref:helix-turn-helix domain-containing protein n=1 Tax=uncultured Kordia sp. TaxID=507699 RepID=UPI00260B9260|nr:helix-turn-helix domain-containing protein [uncultured Kordia sp.]